MKSLERNKIDIWYALYDAKIPILDENGNFVGEYASGYHNPVKIKCRVSPNKGNSSEEAFGIMTDYDRTIITTEKLPLTETSICWVGVVPVINEDGSTNTPNNYKVAKPAEDINVNQYAIKKVVS